MLTRLLQVSVLLTLLGTSPVLADNLIDPVRFSGSVDVMGTAPYRGSYNSGDSTPRRVDDIYALSARMNVSLDDRWNIQVGGEYRRQSLPDVRLDTVDNQVIMFPIDDSVRFGGVIHAYYRNPEKYAFGAFVQHDRGYSPYGFPIGETELIFRDRELVQTTVGLDGQLYFDKVTLYGQASASDARNVLPFDVGTTDYPTEYGLRGEIRYFVTDDFRIDGFGGIRRRYYDFEPPNDVYQVEHLGLQTMARVWNSPVSVFGGYFFERYRHEDAFGTEMFSHNVFAGLRIHGGTGTLLEDDRHGATMTSLPRSAYMRP